jgi:hypothetical protein
VFGAIAMKRDVSDVMSRNFFRLPISDIQAANRIKFAAIVQNSVLDAGHET